MNGCDFKKVIVLGSWHVAEGVLCCLYELAAEYGYGLSYIDSGGNALYNPASAFAKKKGIQNWPAVGKRKLTEFFETVDGKTLIVSAGNFYLFPKQIVGQEHISIVNYHNSLLPDYPGMNAATWAIYNGERETGATWHYVDQGIDTGTIIQQERCQIGDDDKSYHVVARQMKIGIDGFKKCVRSILKEDCVPIPQEATGDRKLYRAKDIPAGGLCRITDDADYIYRLLRAMDYGKRAVFPALRIQMDDGNVVVKRYCRTDAACESEKGVMYKALSGGGVLKIWYRVESGCKSAAAREDRL